jgi:hypothetical protein
LIDLWPTIERHFHSINYSTYLPNWELWVRDTQLAIEASDEKEMKKLILEFKGDFEQLPPQIRKIVATQVGQDIIEKLTANK